MNKIEKRILHGLYFHREMVGEEFVFTAGEIRWLAEHSLPEGKRWLKGDRLQTTDGERDARGSRHGDLTAADDRPLRYLERVGYIERSVMASARNTLQLSVTVAGADYARQLGTWWGRVNLWYRERKDGLLGVLATILVAAVTAMITSRLTAQPHAVTGCSPPEGPGTRGLAVPR